MNLAEDELGALSGRGYIRLFAKPVEPIKPPVAKIPSLFDISAPEQPAAAPAVATAAVPQDADETRRYSPRSAMRTKSKRRTRGSRLNDSIREFQGWGESDVLTPVIYFAELAFFAAARALAASDIFFRVAAETSRFATGVEAFAGTDFFAAADFLGPGFLTGADFFAGAVGVVAA